MCNETDFSEYIPNDSSLKWYQLEPNDAKELVIKLVLFVLCPFAAFLGSLLRPTSKSSFVIYFLFGILFCWHMDPVGLVRYDDYLGTQRVFLHFKYTMSDVYEKFLAYITFVGKDKEIYSIFLNAVTRLFSDNYHLFFAIASIPYLIFSLMSVRKLVSDNKFPLYGLMPLIIILLFVIPRDIVTVQNPRYTTGVWLTMWGFLNYFDKSKSKSCLYFIPILIAPFIHSGFWPMIFIFILAVFLPLSHNIRTIELLFYVSIPFSVLSYDLFSGISYSFLPPVFARWVEKYLSEDSYASFVQMKGTSGFFWVTQLFSYITYCLYLYIPFSLMKRREDILCRYDVGRLYPFYILLFAVTNFIRLLPVIGQRYLYTVQIMSIYMFFKVLYPQKAKYFYFLLGGWALYIFLRWFYSGAGNSLVPKNVYYDNLFYLIQEYL